VRVTKEQVIEWFDNPVTIAVKEAAEQERKELATVRSIDAFAPFEPQRTQEIMSALNAAVDTWDEVIEVLQSEDAILELLEMDDE